MTTANRMRLQAAPAPVPVKSYGQTVPVVPVDVVEEEDVVYKPAIKTAPKVPIRINTDHYVTKYADDDRIDRFRIDDEAARSAKYSFSSAYEDGIMQEFN